VHARLALRSIHSWLNKSTKNMWRFRALNNPLALWRGWIPAWYWDQLFGALYLLIFSDNINCQIKSKYLYTEVALKRILYYPPNPKKSRAIAAKNWRSKCMWRALLKKIFTFLNYAILLHYLIMVCISIYIMTKTTEKQFSCEPL